MFTGMLLIQTVLKRTQNGANFMNAIHPPIHNAQITAETPDQKEICFQLLAFLISKAGRKPIIKFPIKPPTPPIPNQPESTSEINVLPIAAASPPTHGPKRIPHVQAIKAAGLIVIKPMAIPIVATQPKPYKTAPIIIRAIWIGLNFILRPLSN